MWRGADGRLGDISRSRFTPKAESVQLNQRCAGGSEDESGGGRSELAPNPGLAYLYDTFI